MLRRRPSFSPSASGSPQPLAPTSQPLADSSTAANVVQPASLLTPIDDDIYSLVTPPLHIHSYQLSPSQYAS